MITHRSGLAVISLLAAAAVGCGGATGAGELPGQDTTLSSAGTTGAAGSAPAALVSGLGQFTVNLTDAPNPEVKELWVTVTAVTIHLAGAGWIPLTMDVDPPGSALKVDLLQLQGYTIPLGMVNLPAGKVTQIRLLVAPDETVGTGDEMLNYVVLAADGTMAPLKVPSGYQSGIKIMGPWDIAGCMKTAVTLDFDGKQSIWYHPTGQDRTSEDTEWILRPVIRVRDATMSPIACQQLPEDPGTPPPPPPASEAGGSCTTAAECAEGLSCVSSTCVAVPTPVGIGGSCESLDCASGLTCLSGTCVGPVGYTPCSMGAECTSGSCLSHVCSAGPGGAPCTQGSECISGSCSTSGTCGLAPQGSACGAGGDCSSGVCTEQTCVGGGSAPVGAPCSAALECTSTVCSAGTCQPGFQGALCTTLLDCQNGLTCAAGSCAPLVAQ